MSTLKAGDRVKLLRFQNGTCGFDVVPRLVGKVVTVSRQYAHVIEFTTPRKLYAWPVSACEPVPRRITLTLAPDTTVTECGKCPHMGEHCKVFERRVRIWDAGAGQERHKRLPECIAAEVS